MLLLAVFPIVITDPTATSIAVFTLVFMVAATSWNIFSGYSGYLALGHAVFFGSGGYASRWPRGLAFPGRLAVFALLPFGGLVARRDRGPGRADRAAHPPAHLRRRDDRDLLHLPARAFNLGFTGGTSGIRCRSPPFSAGELQPPFYYVALVILVCTVAVSWLVRRSRFGLQLLAIRDDEDRALRARRRRGG